MLSPFLKDVASVNSRAETPAKLDPKAVSSTPTPPPPKVVQKSILTETKKENIKPVENALVQHEQTPVVSNHEKVIENHVSKSVPPNLTIPDGINAKINDTETPQFEKRLEVRIFIYEKKISIKF